MYMYTLGYDYLRVQNLVDFGNSVFSGYSFVSEFEKRGNFAHFPNFGFKMLISLEP